MTASISPAFKQLLDEASYCQVTTLMIDALAKKYRGWEEYPYKDPNNPRVTLRGLPESIREVGLNTKR